MPEPEVTSVVTTVADHVAHVRLSRPSVHNAIDVAVMNGLIEWDGERRVFEGAWVNTEVGSANAVPIVSADLRHVYTVGARDGEWTVEAIDWETGESAFHWVTGSNRYNTLYSGMNLDHGGRIVHTTAFGIVRYEPTAGAG